MKVYFLEIPVAIIHEDERYPDRDTRHIYEHIKYVCSRPSFFPLPAIDVNLVKGKFVVTRGQMHLRIAQELKRAWIRAVFSSDVQDPVEWVTGLASGIRIIPREELECEVDMPVVRGYHVYFFDGPLGPEARERFLVDIAGFFERLETPLIGSSENRLFNWAFSFAGYCGEFEAHPGQ
jgi:hypothetical protein